MYIQYYDSECYSIKLTSLKIKDLKSFVKGTFVGKILWSDRSTQCPANNAAIDLFSYESELFRNFLDAFLQVFFAFTDRIGKFAGNVFAVFYTRIKCEISLYEGK